MQHADGLNCALVGQRGALFVFWCYFGAGLKGGFRAAGLILGRAADGYSILVPDYSGMAIARSMGNFSKAQVGRL
ncbi:hypothetical protein GCM10025791_24470 [Halioxenophilus aromaticivorans]|uniref:Uncharacterized protein n=1 Tax=Halioxenophilus aromaticivorans TaxID=1306992 RepID=A0AAV3U2W2_9ALTE